MAEQAENVVISLEPSHRGSTSNAPVQRVRDCAVLTASAAAAVLSSASPMFALSRRVRRSLNDATGGFRAMLQLVMVVPCSQVVMAR